MSVISEPLLPRPQARPVEWLRRQDHEMLYISTITIAELRTGLAGMPPGTQQGVWREGIASIEKAFEGRILPLDVGAADEFGAVFSRAKAAGNAIAFSTACIAAIARVHGFSIATRDIDDFHACGVQLINPWE